MLNIEGYKTGTLIKKRHKLVVDYRVGKKSVPIDQIKLDL